MDAFSYLSVLLSIILGLAMTQVLQGYRGLLLSRSRVKLYAPTLIWSALILVFATQSWWASFGLVDHRDWTFPQFIVLLMQLVCLYMEAAVVLPDVPAGEAVDLRAHYYRERRPFFLLILAMLGLSVLKDYVIDGHLPTPENLVFHAVFGAGALISLLTRRPWFHEWQAPLVGLLTTLYIAQLFAKLWTGSKRAPVGRPAPVANIER